MRQGWGEGCGPVTCGRMGSWNGESGVGLSDLDTIRAVLGDDFFGAGGIPVQGGRWGGLNLLDALAEEVHDDTFDCRLVARCQRELAMVWMGAI